MSLFLALMLVPVILPLKTEAGNPIAAPREVITLRHCILEYREATSLGSSTYGILQDCPVQLGERVKAGQLLGRLQDIEQQASVGVAEARYRLAQVRVRTAGPLLSTRAVSKDEFDILKSEVETRAMELELARAAVRTREIVSPHSGVIVAVYKMKGAGVAHSSDPVFRVVNTDVLRVTGALDLPDAWLVKPGQIVRIWIEFADVNQPIKKEGFEGRVVFVDSEIDVNTQTCRVVAEVKNRDELLKSGLEARMEIYPEGDRPSGTAFTAKPSSSTYGSGKP